MSRGTGTRTPQTGSSPLPRGRAREYLTSHRLHVALMLAVCLFSYGLFVADPHGVGAHFYNGTTVALLIVIGLGPLLRGARPLSVWMWIPVGAAFLLVSMPLGGHDVAIGPVRLGDVAYYLGYGSVPVCLFRLSQLLGPGSGRGALLDMAAATTGVVLALWTTFISPVIQTGGLPDHLVLAAYPAVDVALLVMCFHLQTRVGRPLGVLRWFTGTLTYQIVLNVAYVITSLYPPEGGLAPLHGAYLFPYLGFAATASHPSIARLTPAVVDENRSLSRNARWWLLLLALTPVVVSTALPVAGTADTVVRTLLVTVLLSILFFRLASSLAALARAEAGSRHRAAHDQLTGVLNRGALLDALERRLHENDYTEHRTALVFLDCDDFKHVNDTWGHHAGDNLLRDLAGRLPGALGSTDILARHGGDEFVVVATVDSEAEALDLADRIMEVFDRPLHVIGERTHRITPSIGIAVTAPGEVTTGDDLLRRADVAMYEAKNLGRGRYVLFDADLDALRRTRATVGDRLGLAIRDNAFHLEIQPLMSGPGYRTLVGWEALARWDDPELGEVEPDVFVPLAEHLGLIYPLGESVLRRACLDLAKLQAAIPEPGAPLPSMCVNVSPSQLLHPGFADVVRDAVAQAGIRPDTLSLEITETMLVNAGEHVHNTLAALGATGVRLCIDDFGTGYASIASLLRLPIDCVKLDKSLLDRVGHEDENGRQLGAVIELIRSLGIDLIISEGVESEEQVRVLEKLGCPIAQGWLFGHSARVEDVLLAARRDPAHAPSR